MLARWACERRSHTLLDLAVGRDDVGGGGRADEQDQHERAERAERLAADEAPSVVAGVLEPRTLTHQVTQRRVTGCYRRHVATSSLATDCVTAGS